MTEPTRKLFASYVSRQLRDAGHERATVSDDGMWTPGFQIEQDGDGVLVYCHGPLGRGDGAGEDARLAEYVLALSNLGYAVETAARPRRLAVSRRTRAVPDA